ncbi:hypothetical protein [Methanosphaera sp. BMS]|uniref:hypothetical protein n=1 Tax=Methanosphaera sp. BMS TaxID=1789762 RepID=UPI000DC1D359|nr:hypothetical protein [Methanosphaera sp. BMS]AWX32213.1 hypothetical protein AW729_03450 [Methanosphaera sp. BMS]
MIHNVTCKEDMKKIRRHDNNNTFSTIPHYAWVSDDKKSENPKLKTTTGNKNNRQTKIKRYGQ